jgi:hypothetical protein
MTRKIKLPKGMKITKSADGKTKVEPDYEAQRRQKPAGQQFWKKDTVKVKK